MDDKKAKQPEPLVKWNPKHKIFANDLMKKSNNHGEFLINMAVAMGKYVKNEERKLSIDDLKWEREIHHECNKCGKCCDMAKSGYGIVLMPTDILNYILYKASYVLVSSSVSQVKDSITCYITLDRKADFVKKGMYRSDKYHEGMISLNPGLALVEEEERDECVFYDNANNECLIHDMRPITCRVYPYILEEDEDGGLLIKTRVDDNLCDKKCFVKGTIDDKDFKEGLTTTLANLKGLEKFFKAKMHSKGSDLFNYYAMMVDACYYCYPDLSNIEELNKLKGIDENAKGNTNTV